jgi:ATP-dependent Lon protease
MAAAKLLPLFPLEVVLLPGAALPLHIFEPRYRLMVGEAIEKKSEFGVILSQDGEIAGAGCTALVKKVTRRYEDGRFDIETIGSRRFLPGALDQSLPYLQASVEYFDDEDRGAVDPADLAPVLELARRVATETGIAIPEISPSDRQPSFLIAAALPLDLPFKQSLLRTRTEAARLRELASHLSELQRRIDKTRQAQQLAGTNGHRRQ